MLRLVQVAGEDARLEAELAVVDLRQRILEYRELGEDRDRAEGFLAVQRGRTVDAFEQVLAADPP